MWHAAINVALIATVIAAVIDAGLVCFEINGRAGTRALRREVFNIPQDDPRARRSL